MAFGSLRSLLLVTCAAPLGVVVVALPGCRVDTATDLVTTIPASQASLAGKWVRLEADACRPTRNATPSKWGHVVYMQHEATGHGHAHRVEGRAGAAPEDLSVALDRLTTGTDDFVNVSPDAAWLVLGTSRLGCGDDTCVALVSADLCAAQVVVAGGAIVHPDGTAAVGTRADGSVVVVYPAKEGPHARDLFAVHKTLETWGAPVLLTGASPHAWNQQPALSDDGTKVLFDCGADPGQGDGMELCEVHTDGTGFRSVLTPRQGPSQNPQNHLHAPDYEPGGGVVFEGTWTSGLDEQVWRVPAGITAPRLVDPTKGTDGLYRFNNDNTPCALPDGRIVSLWLGRAGGGGHHELKLMDASGANSVMLVANIDVADVGTGCSR